MTTTSETADRPALRRPDGTPIRVLVVDDEPTLTDLLSMALRYEGWEVRTAADGDARGDRGPRVPARRRRARRDAARPRRAVEVLRRLRADDPDVPVLFLTARDAVEDRIAGLTAGGDDYVTKPFSLEEVVARLRALLRRSGAAAAAATARARRRRPGAGRGQPRGDAGPATLIDADRDRVRAAALPDAQPAPGAEQGADPRPGLELRLRRPGQRRRALHLLPAQEDRRGPGADDPHHARRRLRAQARGAGSERRRSADGWSLRTPAAGRAARPARRWSASSSGWSPCWPCSRS